jgi:hypothetical protein
MQSYYRSLNALWNKHQVENAIGISLNALSSSKMVVHFFDVDWLLTPILVFFFFFFFVAYNKCS